MDPKMVQAIEADGTFLDQKRGRSAKDPADDDYLLAEIQQQVFPSERIIGGIGEQPAIVHLRDFGVAGFTSCVCVARILRADMMKAITSENYELRVPSTVVPAAGRFTQPNQSIRVLHVLPLSRRVLQRRATSSRCTGDLSSDVIELNSTVVRYYGQKTLNQSGQLRSGYPSSKSFTMFLRCLALHLCLAALTTSLVSARRLSRNACGT